MLVLTALAMWSGGSGDCQVGSDDTVRKLEVNEARQLKNFGPGNAAETMLLYIPIS